MVNPTPPRGYQGIHLIHLVTGDVLVLGFGGALLLHPDGQFTNISSITPARIFCCGHCQLADGRILFAGGDYEYYNPEGGPVPRIAYIIDPAFVHPSNPRDVTCLGVGSARHYGEWRSWDEKGRSAA